MTAMTQIMTEADTCRELVAGGVWRRAVCVSCPDITLNASSHLRRLRDLGLFEMKGAGNRVYYVPSAAFSRSLEPPVQRAVADPHQSTTDPHQVPGDSHQLLAQMPEALRARLHRPGNGKPSGSAIQGGRPPMTH